MSKDPTMMKAGELKAGILAMGGNPSGLVEKGELVAMYRELKNAPRAVETKKYTPDAAPRPPSSAPNNAPPFANANFMGDPSPMDSLKDLQMDPSMMDGMDGMDPKMMNEMMSNPMIQALSNQMMNDPDTMREFQDAMASGKGPGDMMNSPKMMELTNKLMSDPAILQMMSDPNQVNKMMEDMKKMGIKPPY